MLINVMFNSHDSNGNRKSYNKQMDTLSNDVVVELKDSLVSHDTVHITDLSNTSTMFICKYEDFICMYKSKP